MKYLSSILLIALCFSCKKESQLITIEKQIVGNWSLKNVMPILSPSYTVKEPDFDLYFNMFTNSDCFQNSTLTLHSDGKFKTTPGIFICNDNFLNTQKQRLGTWRIIDSSIIIYNGPNSSGTNYKITYLNTNELIIKKEYGLCVFTSDTTIQVMSIPYVYEFGR